MANKSVDTNNKLARISGLNDYLLIPEKTRELLWITDDRQPNSGIVSFDPLSGEAIYGEGIISLNEIDDIQAEPSLIWTWLPVEPNNSKLPKEPFYYPTYRSLSPQLRFQYLNWLRDISQPTWLSFVFLYLYGLERHLVLGNYEAAVDEIKILLKHHDIGVYAYNDLALASVIRGKDILGKMPEIEKNLFDPAWLRAYYKMPLTPTVVLPYAAQAGFTNQRYVKLQATLFNEKLQEAIDELENAMGGAFFDKFTLAGHSDAQLINLSLKRYSENVRIPSARQDDEFEKAIYGLLNEAHTKVRFALHPNTVVKKSNKIIMNSARKKELTAELDEAIERLTLQYTQSAQIDADESDSMSMAQFNKSLAQLDRVTGLISLNPDEAIRDAHGLIDSGYRAPAVYSGLASAYIKKGDYRKGLDTLMQAKVDYGYDFQWELRGLLDRFRSELNPTKSLPSTSKLNEEIDILVSARNRSAWAGIDKALELKLGDKNKLDKKVAKIWRLHETNPQRSLEQALGLFNSGYRTEFICRCVAVGYRRQQKYKEEVDFLIQLKRDFEYYNFDSTIRQAMRLLEKSESKKHKEKDNQEVKVKRDYDILDFENDLRYELQMLLGSSRIAGLYRDNGYEDMEKYFNDSAYIHTRNLYNFLKTDKMPSKNDINIFRFCKDPSLKSATSSYYSEWEESLNRHVSHIAPGRLKPTNENGSGEHLNSKVMYFANDIMRLWAECTNTISDEYINDMLKRVLKDAQKLADNDYKRALAFLSDKH